MHIQDFVWGRGEGFDKKKIKKTHQKFVYMYFVTFYKSDKNFELLISTSSNLFLGLGLRSLKTRLNLNMGKICKGYVKRVLI